jgi:hypothetical protein
MARCSRSPVILATEPGVGPHGRVDIPCPLHYTIFDVSTPVWLMPGLAEAATAEEVIDEETTGQSVLRFRASGPAGAPVSLPVPRTPQLLTLAWPVSLCPEAVSPGVAGAWPDGMITDKDRSPSPRSAPLADPAIRRAMGARR